MGYNRRVPGIQEGKLSGTPKRSDDSMGKDKEGSRETEHKCLSEEAGEDTGWGTVESESRRGNR